MQPIPVLPWRWSLTTALLLFGSAVSLPAADPQGSPIPASPEFTSPDIKPTFADWLRAKPVALARKMATTDPLLRPPFGGAPADSVKGMAAGIRTVQLDAPNRAKAAAFLGTVDCVTYPQAQDMLIATMKDDPSEDVRYEAVMALRMMLTRGCSGLETECECESCSLCKIAARQTEQHSQKLQRQLIKEAKGPAKKQARQASRDVEDQRFDCCRGCCNPKVLTALADVAYGKDDQCCWVEPSERVRLAAAEGLCLCPTFAAQPGDIPPVPQPEPTPLIKEVGPAEEKETPPAPTLETPPTTEAAQGADPVQQVALLLPTAGQPLPVIAGLKGYCVVSLKHQQFQPANPAFSSTFEDRTYLFCSAEAKSEFDANPAAYAPAYGGLDPVEWLQRGQLVEGQYLRSFDGRFFLFAAKENWETFKATPQRFVLNAHSNAGRLAAADRSAAAANDDRDADIGGFTPAPTSD